MLAAHDIGLGSCWVMYFDPMKTRELFALPENIVPVAILPVGYPAENAVPAPGHLIKEPIGALLLKK
jgi:nitroreductase